MPAPDAFSARFFSFEDLSSEERSSFDLLVTDSLDGNFDNGFAERLKRLGSRIAGHDFELALAETAGLPFDLKNQSTFYGEVCALLRLLAVPNEYLIRLLFHHAGLEENSPLFLSGVDAAQLALGDQTNPYHNAKHANSFSYMAVTAARLAKLDTTSQALLAIVGQIHDLRHPGLTATPPPRHDLERKALALFGIEKVSLDEESVTIEKICVGSPAARLKESQQRQIAQMVLDTYSGDLDALRVREVYRESILKQKEVSPFLLMRAIAVEADLRESLSRAGNKISSEACFNEMLQTHQRLHIPLSAEEREKARFFYISNQHAFVEKWKPQTVAFQQMGMLAEAESLLRENPAADL